VNRYTFVFHAYPGGTSMLENLSTHERVRVCDLAAVGPQIERWLASLTRSEESVASGSAPSSFPVAPDRTITGNHPAIE
jgi:hypothetical protein